MRRDREKHVASALLAAGFLAGWAAWWLANPLLVTCLGRVPGRAGVAAVGLGLWAAFALCLATGLFASMTVLRRIFRRPTSRWIAKPSR